MAERRIRSEGAGLSLWRFADGLRARKETRAAGGGIADVFLDAFLVLFEALEALGDGAGEVALLGLLRAMECWKRYTSY